MEWIIWKRHSHWELFWVRVLATRFVSFRNAKHALAGLSWQRILFVDRIDLRMDIHNNKTLELSAICALCQSIWRARERPFRPRIADNNSLIGRHSHTDAVVNAHGVIYKVCLCVWSNGVRLLYGWIVSPAVFVGQVVCRASAHNDGVVCVVVDISLTYVCWAHLYIWETRPQCPWCDEPQQRNNESI